MNLPFQSLLARFGLLLSLGAGALLPFAFAPYGIWPLALLCPAWLFLTWQHVSPKRAAALGFWFGVGEFGAGTYWLYNSIHTIGDAPIWVTLLLMMGMVALMASYLALMGYLQARWLPATGLARYLLGLPALWLLLEWFRGWFLSGFPWLSLGYSQIDTPLAGLAPIAGVYAVSLACAISAGALLTVVIGNMRQRWVGITVAALLWLAAAATWHHVWTQPRDAAISVAIVQGAVPQNKKWSQDWRDKTLTRYRSLAEPYFGTQLIVWPEAALPDVSYQLTEYLSALWSDAKARNSDIIMGLLHYDATQQQMYNGVLSLSDDVEWYHKRHLVPFGEFFPVPKFVRSWLRLMSLPYSDFDRGAAQQPPLNAAGQKIGMTICYEDGFGAEQLYVLRDATLLANVTNDAWFGDSSAPPQHLEISRMRALESGRDMIRAANDGISAIIRSDGKVLATSPRFQAMVLTGSVQPRTGLTPYAYVGNWPVIVGSALLVLLTGMIRYRQQRKLSQPSQT